MKEIEEQVVRYVIKKVEKDNNKYDYLRIVKNSTMVNFRYVFRYVLLGLPSATECSKGQPSAELTSQVLPKAPKIPNTKSHVAVVKNTKIVVVDS